MGLHVDLNSFSASVVKKLCPEYRGRAIAVVGTMADTGTILSASYRCLGQQRRKEAASVGDALDTDGVFDDAVENHVAFVHSEASVLAYVRA